MKVQVIKIQLYKPTYYSGFIDVVQNDNARIFQFELPKEYRNNATDIAANFSAKKPSGKSIKNPCVVDENGNFLYRLTEQTTAEVGVVRCQLELYSTIDGKKITSFEFKLSVKEELNSDTAVTSTDEWGVITELREEIVEIRDEILEALAGKDFAEKLRELDDKLTEHIEDTNNPHGVTPNKIGTYTQVEIDEMLSNVEPSESAESITTECILKLFE